jgi:SAM-dependent methyltransferase
MGVTLPAAYFDDLYRRSADPWSFQTRWYEERKRRLTLDAMPNEHYGSVFEPGCSIGVLTAGLAARADRVLAMDVSDGALAEADRRRPANVRLVRGAIPEDWPEGRFDLVVLSEVGYYLSAADCQTMAERAVVSASDLVAVHWRHPVEEYPLGGDEVHRLIARAAIGAGLVRLARHVEADFRLEVWSRDSRSTAGRTAVPGVSGIRS